MLTKAAKRFDKGFAALPPNVQKTVALAIYRVAPSLAQYQKDLAPLFESEEIRKACGDLLLAGAWQLVKRGLNGFSPDVVDRVAEAAPTTARFMRNVTSMLEGAFAGKVIEVAPDPPALAAAPEVKP
jgi:hypothetical protein